MDAGDMVSPLISREIFNPLRALLVYRRGSANNKRLRKVLHTLLSQPNRSTFCTDLQLKFANLIQNNHTAGRTSQPRRGITPSHFDNGASYKLKLCGQVRARVLYEVFNARAFEFQRLQSGFVEFEIIPDGWHHPEDAAGSVPDRIASARHQHRCFADLRTTNKGNKPYSWICKAIQRFPDKLAPGYVKRHVSTRRRE